MLTKSLYCNSSIIFTNWLTDWLLIYLIYSFTK